MKLRKLQLQNYKSIHDTTEFDLGDITCLVGKNEAGKSAILEALYKLKPVETGEAEFVPIDHYLDLDVTVTDQVTGSKGVIEEEFPIPRIGAQGAIPYKNFLFEGKLSGLFIDYDDFEGYAVEADVSATWRP